MAFSLPAIPAKWLCCIWQTSQCRLDTPINSLHRLCLIIPLQKTSWVVIDVGTLWTLFQINKISQIIIAFTTNLVDIKLQKWLQQSKSIATVVSTDTTSLVTEISESVIAQDKFKKMERNIIGKPAESIFAICRLSVEYQV